MITARTYSYFFALLFAMCLHIIPYTLFAQEVTETELGISFQGDISQQSVIQRLDQLEELGIQVLEFQHPVPSVLLDSLSNKNFTVFIRSNVDYLTSYQLISNLEEYNTLYKQLVDRYKQYEVVKAIGLFSFRQSDSANFKDYITNVASIFPDSLELTLYEVASTPLESTIPIVLRISDINNLQPEFNYLLEKEYHPSDFELVAESFSYKTPLLLLESTWFEEAILDYPPFIEALVNYRNTSSFIIPLPSTTEEDIPFEWPILVFFLIWVSVGIHLKAAPTYRDTMMRYFTYHRFFVDDIMRFRERSIVSGIFLLLQHALFTGLLVYIIATYFISDVGLDAFYYHIPLLGIFGNNYFSLFAITVVLTFLVEFIGLLWLYLPSKSMQHISQTVNLYSWIFHLDFILISCMLILTITNSTSILIPIMAIFFVLFWLLGFSLCAYDSSKYLQKGKTSYLFYTIGLHTIVNVALLVFVLTNDQILDILKLTSSL